MRFASSGPQLTSAEQRRLALNSGSGRRWSGTVSPVRWQGERHDRNMSDAESQPGISRHEDGKQMEALGKTCRCTQLSVGTEAFLGRVLRYVTVLAMPLHAVAIAVHRGRHARIGCCKIVVSMFMACRSHWDGCSLQNPRRTRNGVTHQRRPQADRQCNEHGNHDAKYLHSSAKPFMANGALYHGDTSAALSI